MRPKIKFSIDNSWRRLSFQRAHNGQIKYRMSKSSIWELWNRSLENRTISAGETSLVHACIHSFVSNSTPPWTIGSSIHGVSQTRILEWVAISSRGSSQLTSLIHISCTGRQIFLPLSHLGSQLSSLI